jgi:ribonuclease HI
MGGGTFEFYEHLGTATNNMAEYEGLILGLRKAKKLGAEDLSVFLDSELLVKQLNGLYRVKDEKLKLLFNKATALVRSFKKITVVHVPREENREADALARKGAALRHREKKEKKASASQLHLDI